MTLWLICESQLTLGFWKSYLRGLMENHEPVPNTNVHYAQDIFERFVSPFLKPYLGNLHVWSKGKGKFPGRLVSLLFF